MTKFEYLICNIAKYASLLTAGRPVSLTQYGSSKKKKKKEVLTLYVIKQHKHVCRFSFDRLVQIIVSL